MSDLEHPPSKRLTPADNVFHKFCFLDESGSLNSAQSPFFTIGIVKIAYPQYLAREISKERNRKGFYDEMHFNKTSKQSVDFSKSIINLAFADKRFRFMSYTLDKKGDYFQKVYEGDPWRAYEAISAKLISSTTQPFEMLTVLADHVDTPRYVNFEKAVSSSVNGKAGETVIAGITRIDSKCNDILQVADLMIGCVNYELKVVTGVAEQVSPHKMQIVELFKENLGATTFIEGFKNYNFNIFVDQDIKIRMPKKPVAQESNKTGDL